MPQALTTRLKGRRARTGFDRLVIPSFFVLVAAQIALPLSDAAVAGWTMAVVVLLCLTTVLIARDRWRTERLVIAFCLVTGFSLLVEWTGTTTGWPFGRYAYSDGLRPQIGGVPVIVPVAWFSMGIPALAVSRLLTSSRLLLVATTGFLLMAWDVLLDPQMVANGFWSWSSNGWGLHWQGIPLTNYVGWWASGTVVAWLLQRSLGTASPSPDGGTTSRSPLPLLVALYAWMIGFTSFGFLLPFVFDRPIVGVVGAVLGLPLPLLALGRQRTHGHGTFGSRHPTDARTSVADEVSP